MYRNINDGQFSIYDFILPFGGHLKEDNRWVQLRNMIDWQIIDEEYRRHFRNKAAGQEAYPSSVAFGSLYIQRRLGLTDRELIDQISENPYMQYFIGYKEFRDEKPFDASLLVTFRKRLPEDVMNRIGMEEGFDVGLEMSGSATALNQMIHDMKHGGNIALLGLQDVRRVLDGAHGPGG